MKAHGPKCECPYCSGYDGCTREEMMQHSINTLTKKVEAYEQAMIKGRRTISSGRTINNFGHVPEVRRALEWVLIDFDKDTKQALAASEKDGIPQLKHPSK